MFVGMTRDMRLRFYVTEAIALEFRLYCLEIFVTLDPHMGGPIQVVLESGYRDLARDGAAADPAVPLDDAHLQLFPSQRRGADEPVDAAADDDNVEFRHSRFCPDVCQRNYLVHRNDRATGNHTHTQSLDRHIYFVEIEQIGFRAYLVIDGEPKALSHVRARTDR